MKRGGYLKRGKRVNPVSEKRAEVNELRRDFVNEQLARRPYCEAGRRIGEHIHGQRGRWWDECRKSSSQMHEPLTRKRAPGSDTILDEKNSVATCAWCHDWIHKNDDAAESIGLLVPSSQHRLTKVFRR